MRLSLAFIVFVVANTLYGLATCHHYQHDQRSRTSTVHFTQVLDILVWFFQYSLLFLMVQFHHLDVTFINELCNSMDSSYEAFVVYKYTLRHFIMGIALLTVEYFSLLIFSFTFSNGLSIF